MDVLIAKKILLSDESDIKEISEAQNTLKRLGRYEEFERKYFHSFVLKKSYYGCIGKENTHICKTGDVIQVGYYSTLIFHLNIKEHALKLFNGGQWTSLTKKKINQCFNFFCMSHYLYQKQGNWYIDLNKKKPYRVYENGMTLNVKEMYSLINIKGKL